MISVLAIAGDGASRSRPRDGCPVATGGVSRSCVASALSRTGRELGIEEKRN
jgi:hypothetical protein